MQRYSTTTRLALISGLVLSSVLAADILARNNAAGGSAAISGNWSPTHKSP
jgi:hypothetical protein